MEFLATNSILAERALIWVAGIIVVGAVAMQGVSLARPRTWLTERLTFRLPVNVLYILADKLLLLVLVPGVIVNLFKWSADHQSPYSNYWSNTDSLGPLLWLSGDIQVTDETVWGQLVQGTALPFLRAVAWSFPVFGWDAYDFQHAIVFANVFIWFAIPLVLAVRFKSVLVGMFALSVPAVTAVGMGYNSIFGYGDWGSFRPYSGILSMNAGVLVLALYFARLRWLAIAACALLTFFHPATGGIITAFLALSMALESRFSTEELQSRRMQYTQIGVLLLPALLMLLWERTSGVSNVGSDYPWDNWWKIVVANVAMHVKPWLYRETLVVASFGYVFMLAPVVYLIRTGIIRAYIPFAAVLLGSLGFLCASIVFSEYLHFYTLTGLYMHKATGFASFAATIMFVKMLMEDDIPAGEQVLVHVAIAALILDLPLVIPAPWPGQPLGDGWYDGFFTLHVGLYMGLIAGWLLAAARLFDRVRWLWLGAMTALFAAMLSNSFYPVWITGLLGVGICLWHAFGPPSPRLLLAVVALVAMVPIYANGRSDLEQVRLLANNGWKNPYKTPGELLPGTRAEVFHWLRTNTDESDVILDPPMDRQDHGPTFGYNELLSHREHLMTAKEAHVFVYVHSTLYPAMRDFTDVYGLEIPGWNMFSGQMEPAYNKIDDARLATLAQKYPRLKYFVREKKVGAAIYNFPVVFDNTAFEVFCLKC